MNTQILPVSFISSKCAKVFDNVDFVQKAYLFGSYARGEAKPESDLDFVIVLNREAILEFFALYDLLQDALGKNVDVVREEEALRIMPRTFERDKVLIYEREN